MSAPRVARWLIATTAPVDRRADMLGDLDEVHQRRRASGAARAWLASVLDATLIAAAVLGDRLREAASIDPRQWVSLGDLRAGLRLMWREPILTLTAMAALTLGIGLATVGFATVETFLFSHLPFEGGDRFVLIRAIEEPERRPARLTPEDYRLLSAQTTMFEHLGAASQGRESVRLPSGDVREAITSGITPTSLAFLPYRAVRGRLLQPSDGVPGALPVVMIHERFWRGAFGGADETIGQTMDVGGVARAIVGVAPNDFAFPSTPPDLWTPIGEAALAGRGQLDPNARLFGVLAPGRFLESAQAQLDAVATHLTPVAGATGHVRLEATSPTDLGPQAWVMSSAILFVVLAILIVVAANVANLILARSFGRSRELAVRAALGASRGRLVGQISVEVVLVVGVAALVGVSAAEAVLRRLNAMDELPFWVDFTAGPRTAFMVVGATLLVTTIAGAWPALRATRGDLIGALQSGGGRSSEVRFGRAAGVMVIAQIALSIVMLHGALVVAEGFSRYSGATLDLPSNVLKAGLRFARARSSAGESSSPSLRADDVEMVAAALPGVMAAGLTTELPRHSPATTLVEVETLPGDPPQTPRMAPWAEVSAGFFAALDASVLAGRNFVDADFGPAALPAAVVNAPFVLKFLGGASPVGRRFRTVGVGGPPGPWQEIVGVVPDLGLSIGDPSLAAGFYVPLRFGGPETARRFTFLTMRVAGDPLEYVGALRQALYARDPELVLDRPGRLEDVAGEDQTFLLWFSTVLIGLGVVTLVLALAGVYAMMSLIVARRTREIGIRVALGATSGLIIRTILGRAAWQVGVGGALGAVLAFLSLNARAVLVSRLPDGGMWTLPTVLALLVAAGLIATFLPLRRALRVQPSEALRVEQ